MIKQPGKRVKTLAVLLLLLHISVGLLLGVAVERGFVAAAAMPDAVSALRNAPVFVFPLVGALIGYVNTILLYAFGALVDEAETIRTELTSLCLDVAEIRKEVEFTARLKSRD